MKFEAEPKNGTKEDNNTHTHTHAHEYFMTHLTLGDPNNVSFLFFSFLFFSFLFFSFLLSSFPSDVPSFGRMLKTADCHPYNRYRYTNMREAISHNQRLFIVLCSVAEDLKFIRATSQSTGGVYCTAGICQLNECRTSPSTHCSMYCAILQHGN